jgi:hypothetical protein
LPAAETLFCSSFFRDSEHSSHRLVRRKLLGQKTDYIDCKSKDSAMGMEDRRYGTLSVED